MIARTFLVTKEPIWQRRNLASRNRKDPAKRSIEAIAPKCSGQFCFALVCLDLHDPVGAKNWLFFGSAQSGTMGAVLYTLVENVRRLNRDPFEYLTWVFSELARNPQPENPQNLLPKAWAKATPKASSSARRKMKV